MGLPQRKHIRMKGYDYSSAGAYFVTICTQDRIHYFGEIINGIMQFSILGEYCTQIIEQLPNKRSTIAIHEYIVMPNHIHMVIVMKERMPSTTKSVADTRGRANLLDLLDNGNGNANRRTNLLDLPNNGNRNANGRANLLDLPNNGNGNAKSISLHDVKYDVKYQGPTLGSIIGMMKQSVTKFAIQYNISFQRQSRFHEHIIRNEQSYGEILYYIRNNPINRQKDKFYT